MMFNQGQAIRKVNLFSAQGKTIHRRGAEALRKNNGL